MHRTTDHQPCYFSIISVNNITNYGNNISAKAASQTKWDAIIIGAGMGGGACAYALAKAGNKVLLVDKGLAAFSQKQSVTREENDPVSRIANGRWPTQLTGVVDGRRYDFWPPLGSGMGGSTLLYAAALSRLRKEDFAAKKSPIGDQPAWPFSFAELKPYYQQAEALLSVRGTDDPLTPDTAFNLPAPAPMCERDAFFFKAFAKAGLHPHELHSGIAYVNDCQECLGEICLKKCKSDANNSFIQPAMASGNLFLCGETEASHINAAADYVDSVVVKHKGQQYKIKGKIIVLAAGGLFTPSLLLRSKSDNWPSGVGNRHDQVGRNLMFHADNFIAFWAPKNLSTKGPKKTIVARDYYSHDGVKYGEFQSTGLSAGYGNVLYSLRFLFDQSIFRKIPLLRQTLRIPAYLASKIFGDATIFTTLIEDFPYPENRVVLDDGAPSGIRFEYTIHTEFRERANRYKRMIRKKLGTLRSLPMQKELGLNHGHPCGTCKAGVDPENSVVDKNCRAHGVNNLYVADSSFMPSSGGTNPSLTIAANALRVADAINQQLKQIESDSAPK